MKNFSIIGIFQDYLYFCRMVRGMAFIPCFYSLKIVKDEISTTSIRILYS